MSMPFLGEIRIFAFNRTPDSWHLCDGSLLNVNGNEALFALIGTTYGGNGTTNFGLPDMRGRLPVGQGQGPGLSSRVIAQKGGASTVTLTENNMPHHTHGFSVSGTQGTQNKPVTGAALAVPQPQPGGTIYAYAPPTAGTAQTFAQNVISTAPGGNQAHVNMMPCMALNYYIAIKGIYPEKP